MYGLKYIWNSSIKPHRGPNKYRDQQINFASGNYLVKLKKGCDTKPN